MYNDYLFDYDIATGIISIYVYRSMKATVIKKMHIDDFEKYGAADIDMYEVSDSEFDIDDGNTEYFTVGKKVKIELADMDYKSWRKELKADVDVLERLLMVADITLLTPHRLPCLVKG